MKRIIIAAVIVCVGFGVSYAKSYKVDFEAKLGNEWTLEGDAGTSTEQKHGGTKSLKIVPMSVVSYIISEKNVFGTVTMYAYDGGENPKSPKKYNFGGRWGLIDADESKLVFGMIFAEWVNGNSNYNWGSSAASTSHGGWEFADRYYTNFKRSKGWHKWAFEFSGKDDLMVYMDDEAVKPDCFKMETAQFGSGFTGLYFLGGDKRGGSEILEAPVYIDDITIQTK